MTEREAQTKQILRYMQDGHRITDAKARAFFGCSRLSARIWDIEHQCGVPVQREFQYKLDSDGKVVKKWKAYWLARQ